MRIVSFGKMDWKLFEETVSGKAKIMEEQNQNQDLYHIDFMRTLWQNTYRGTVFDSMDRYVATIRMLLGVPIPREELPENAPVVAPLVTVLIEDTILTPLEIIDFETILSKLILQKASSQDFRPDRCMFFYPSPADAAQSTEK